MMSNFGRDISCTRGLRTGRFVSGPRLVAEAIYRRLTTPRGTLRGGPAEANYGIDLTELVGSAATKRDAAALPGRITTEILKDERIERVEVTVTQSVDGPAVSFAIVIEGETAEGPFALQLLASEVTVELLNISAGGG